MGEVTYQAEAWAPWKQDALPAACTFYGYMPGVHRADGKPTLTRPSVHVSPQERVSVPTVCWWWLIVETTGSGKCLRITLMWHDYPSTRALLKMLKGTHHHHSMEAKSITLSEYPLIEFNLLFFKWNKRVESRFTLNRCDRCERGWRACGEHSPPVSFVMSWCAWTVSSVTLLIVTFTEVWDV